MVAGTAAIFAAVAIIFPGSWIGIIERNNWHSNFASQSDIPAESLKINKQRKIASVPPAEGLHKQCVSGQVAACRFLLEKKDVYSLTNEHIHYYQKQIHGDRH